jgi:molybdopterin synthase sulfur carrier subunit
MTIRILYFAAVRDLVGLDEEALSLQEDVRTIADLAALLARHHPVLAGRLSAVRFARNETFARSDELLSDGDEIALIPPVAGG